MGLYQKHRPTHLKRVVGNSELITAVNAALKAGNFPHASLFVGPHGCGKTTIARIIANSLGCSGNDLREINSADFRGIDTIRDLLKQSQYKPLESSCRVWIIDECHKLTNDAQSAFLKALEDTPEHVYFILCTTNPEKLLNTVKSRTATFTVNLLNEEQLTLLINRVLSREKEELDPKVMEQIITDSLGHARDALQILEQVLAVEPAMRLTMAKKAAAEQSQTIELCRALIGKKGWKEVAAILTGLKDQEAESIRRAVLGYCQAILLKGSSNEKAASIIEVFMDNLYDSGFPGLTYMCYVVVNG